jgi:hypothetical protein
MSHLATFVAAATFFYLIGLHRGIRRGARDGFEDGERYGIIKGYRTAWLKSHRPLLNPQTGDFYDDLLWRRSDDE